MPERMHIHFFLFSLLRDVDGFHNVNRDRADREQDQAKDEHFHPLTVGAA